MRAHLVTLASVLAVMASAWALDPLLAGPWARPALLVVGALAWGTAWLRKHVRNAVLPTVLGLGALAYGIAVGYLSPPGAMLLLPDSRTLDRLGPLAAAVVEQVRTGVAPLDATPALTATVVAGVGVVYLMVELCCFGLRLPAWSALPLLGLWLPAISVHVPVPGWVFATAAVTWLVLLALRPEPAADRGEERRRGLRITATWAALLAVVTLALVPLVARVPGWGATPLPRLGPGGPGAVLLGSDLRMGQSLAAQSAEVAFRYSADPVATGPLRLHTMHEFDGESWRLDESSGPSTPTEADEVLWPEPVDPLLLAGTAARLEVEIVGLREDRLPIPVTPRTVTTPGRWFYDPSRDEVHRTSPTRPGETYSVSTTTGGLTAELLQGLGHGSPDGAEAFLDVPDTPHREDIVHRAHDVTADAGTAYERALLLQSYLRSPPFRYETEVPAPATGDAVWDFLESGRGYCVQFATAMTIMARSLGIPARMAVGFLPGTAARGSPRTYEVRGDRAHTWPELHFAGVGWVRFEPTPAVQSGLPPSYADPFANTGAEPVPQDEVPTPTATPTNVPAPTAPTSPRGTGSARDESWWFLVGGAVVVLTAAAAAVLLRRRRPTEPLDAESAWTLLRTRLARLAVTWQDSQTPRQVARSVERQIMRRRGGPLDATSVAALELLATAVERGRYAPHAPAVEPADLEDAVLAVVGAVTPTDGPAPGSRMVQRPRS